jgi:hypothetical protein
MDARWTPLLAAAVGFLGGVGGALIGGLLAIEAQEQQSESERAAAIENLRIDTYGDYLGSAEALVGKLSLDFSEPQRDAALVRLLSLRARVFLVAEEPEVMFRRSNAITEAVTNDDQDAYDDAAQNFAEAARNDIDAARK